MLTLRKAARAATGRASVTTSRNHVETQIGKRTSSLQRMYLAGWCSVKLAPVQPLRRKARAGAACVGLTEVTPTVQPTADRCNAVLETQAGTVWHNSSALRAGELTHLTSCLESRSVGASCQLLLQVHRETRVASPSPLPSVTSYTREELLHLVARDWRQVRYFRTLCVPFCLCRFSK